MTLIIGSIAVLAMWPPFVAERIYWNKGKRQTEAQRDAQMALRAMARVARESSAYTVVDLPGPDGLIGFVTPTGDSRCFLGGPGASYNGQLIMRLDCDAPPSSIVLIDGIRSRVEEFSPATVVSNRLAGVRLRVSHRLRTTDTRQEDEILDTTLFLRNGPTS